MEPPDAASEGSFTNEGGPRKRSIGFRASSESAVKPVDQGKRIAADIGHGPPTRTPSWKHMRRLLGPAVGLERASSRESPGNVVDPGGTQSTVSAGDTRFKHFHQA